jgi:tRNA threonylcarbamoyladenosine biosynthesis protein TsaB
MRILALASAVARCSATIVSDELVVAGYQKDMDRGHATVLAGMAQDALHDAAIDVTMLDLIAVTVGPGSFTGIRGALALALGIGISADVQVVGVTVGEALADSLPFLGGRPLWCAMPSRRGRVFLEIGASVRSLAVTDLPAPDRPVAIAGNAADDVASRLAAQGFNVMLTDAKLPLGRHIAQVAARRYQGLLRPLPAEPLYIDPPEARLPGGRPHPSVD